MLMFHFIGESYPFMKKIEKLELTSYNDRNKPPWRCIFLAVMVVNFLLDTTIRVLFLKALYHS